LTAFLRIYGKIWTYTGSGQVDQNATLNSFSYRHM